MKQVLSVGQCSFDHGSISRFLKGHFEVEVVPVATASKAMDLLRKHVFDLVLVNRQFDADGGEGLDLVNEIKQDETLAMRPIMLITNYPKYDQQAVVMGAVSGFGKNELGSPEVVRKLEPYLC
jgi:DNA-binding NarL/FixJ family response regulator